MTPAATSTARRNILMKPTWMDWLIAGLVGTGRRVADRQLNLNKNAHAQKSDFQTEIIGTIGEQMAARYYKVNWNPHVVTSRDPEVQKFWFKGPDAGPYQVRSTDYSSGHLIIRPNDKDEQARFVLVTVEPGAECVLVGTKRCIDAKQPRYWKEDSWWVPQSDLEEL